MGNGFWACIYIFYSNISSMVIYLQGLDKYEIKSTDDGKTYKKTRPEVQMVKIYKFVRSNFMTCDVTKCQTLTTQVSQNVGH